MTRVTEETEHQPGHRRRSPGEYAGLVARGFAMGSADVVPGVSGGTMAFILGIYEELIESIRKAGEREFLKALFTLRWGRALRMMNWQFLVAVLSGILLAVLTLAQALEWLLVNQPVLVWSFFFGLVLASAHLVSQRIPRWRASLWVALVIATVATYFFVGLVPVETPETWWFLFLAGAVAICAMILPGISGAFLLLLLGKYEYVLSAVNDREITPLLFVIAGAVIGLVSFAQLLGWLFRNYHDLTVAVLTGFMVGSLRKVWPWKRGVEFTVDRHGERVPVVEENILPPLTIDGAFNLEILSALGLGLLGLAIVVVIEKWANGKESSRESAER